MGSLTLSLLFLLGLSRPQTSTVEEKLAQVRAYHRVSERLATSGQLDYVRIPDIKEGGFEAVVNLATAQKERNASEGFLVAEHGMTYVHIPVPWENPDLRDLALFFDVMDALRERRVWVHCNANMRASAFVYLYRTLRLREPETTARPDLAAIWDPATEPRWSRLIEDARRRWGSSP